MIIKSKSAGDLFRYIRGPKGKFGKLREDKELLGNTEQAVKLLGAQAPPYTLVDKRRRYVRHCRRHLTHIYTGFSEDLKKVESVLPVVIKTIEAAVLIGLPREALPFVWHEHPQSIGGHVHCGLLHSAMPEGGPYEPGLSPLLLFRLARLLSYQLELSDPLEPERARLIRPGPASASNPENQPVIEKVVDAVEQAEPPLQSHGEFIRLLVEQLGLEIASRPTRGRACPVDPAVPNGHKRYPGTVGVWHPDGHQRGLVYFSGPICHPGFDRTDWLKELDDRQAQISQLAEDPGTVYRDLRIDFEQRVAAQQNLYKVEGKDRVLEPELAWLGVKRTAQTRRELLDRLSRFAEEQETVSDRKALAAQFGRLPRLYYAEEAFVLDQRLSSLDNPLKYNPTSTYPFVEPEMPLGKLWEITNASSVPPQPIEEKTATNSEYGVLPWDSANPYSLPLPPGDWTPRIAETSMEADSALPAEGENIEKPEADLNTAGAPESRPPVEPPKAPPAQPEPEVGTQPKPMPTSGLSSGTSSKSEETRKESTVPPATPSVAVQMHELAKKRNKRLRELRAKRCLKIGVAIASAPDLKLNGPKPEIV